MLKVFELQIPLNTILNPMLITGRNILFRTKGDKDTGTKKDTQVKTQKKEDQDKELLCAKCNHLITSSSKKIEISGHHSHLLTNPAGEKFDLRCFSEAQGCEIKGVPIPDFSWFAGYKWTFAFCANCSIQSGWIYISPNDNFFGLIRKAIIGEY